MPTLSGAVRILRNMTGNAAKALRTRALKLLPARDDEDWNDYRRNYEQDLVEVARLHTQRLHEGDYAWDGGKLCVRPELKPLHPNCAALYETVAALKAESALEVGCGGGDHLHNLSVLLPQLALRGIDVSPGQLDLLCERSPEVAGLASFADVTNKTLPFPPDSFDVVYSQAVIMHIQRRGAHLRALENMFTTARKHVVLMENWARHWFMDDIIELQYRGRIAWPSLHLYFRRYDGRPIIMVASRDPRLPFEHLTDYATLLDANGWRPPPTFKMPPRPRRRV